MIDATVRRVAVWCNSFVIGWCVGTGGALALYWIGRAVWWALN
jgi:hypothetical protein